MEIKILDGSRKFSLAWSQSIFPHFRWCGFPHTHSVTLCVVWLSWCRVTSVSRSIRLSLLLFPFISCSSLVSRLTRCRRPFVPVHHNSFATINYREHNQSVYEDKVLLVSRMRAVTDGRRLKCRFASRRSQLCFFFFIDFPRENGCH